MASFTIRQMVAAVDPHYRDRQHCYEFSNGRRFFEDNPYDTLGIGSMEIEGSIPGDIFIVAPDGLSGPELDRWWKENA